MKTGWVLCKVKTRQESYAARQCETQPQVFEALNLKFRNELTGKVETLFPTYLFVRTYHGQWRFLESTKGILYVIKRGEAPDTITHKEINRWKRKRNAEGLIDIPQQGYKVGQRLIPSTGTFKGHEGIYQGMTRDQRVKVLFELLSSKVEVEYRKSQVELAA